MSEHFNQVVLAGHLETTPSLARRQGGGMTATLLLVTRRQRREGGEQSPIDSLHTIKAFDSKATAIGLADLRPGDQLFIEGRLEYVRKSIQGRPVHVAEIIAERIIVGARNTDIPR